MVVLKAVVVQVALLVRIGGDAGGGGVFVVSASFQGWLLSHR